MLKSLKFGRKIYNGAQRLTVQKRLFLTDTYRCEEAWKGRFESPILQNVNLSYMFIQVNQLFNTSKKISAVDVDIFANCAENEPQVYEVLSLLHNLRLTSEATKILDSTHHAVIRFLLDQNCIEELTSVLHDRLNYGVFPDSFCYNLLMDTLIKKEQYAHAAKVATLTMLQEDRENPITNAMSIYSCHKYLEKPDEWQKPIPEEDTGEEVKVRVDYIRNPYFDDHFDLVEPRDLVGKTLAFHGHHMNNLLGRTCELRGLILYKKYKDASDLIKKCLQSNKDETVYGEVFELIKQDNSYIPEDQVTEEFKDLLSKLETLKKTKLNNDSLTECLKNNVILAVNEQAEKDIAQQCQDYQKWNEMRMIELKKQEKMLDHQARLAKVEKLKQQLAEKEQVLTFFDREEDIELQIEEKERKEREADEKMHRLYNSAKKLRKITEEQVYVPPQI